jgi:FG-GAP-like repeat
MTRSFASKEILLFVVLAAAASCRGDYAVGQGASCDDAHPCRPHYSCNGGTCEPEEPRDGSGDADAGADAGIEAGADAEADADAGPSFLCTPACTAEETCCVDRCADLDVDPRNCGQCGTPCSGARAIEACNAGKCVVAKCELGWGDCNGDPMDGCETSLLDPTTCGDCKHSCKVKNGTSACADGTCTPVTCDKGYIVQDRSCLACSAPMAALCGRGSNGIVCARARANGTLATPVLYTADFDDASWADITHASTIQFPDVDGDGWTDVCGRRGDGVFCSLGVGGNSFGSIVQWSPLFEDPYWKQSPARYLSLRFPDVNGDGMSDLCADAETNLLCAQSDGGKFVLLQQWSGDFGSLLNFDQDSYIGTQQFPDVDGDGHADVCGRMPDGIRCGTANTGFFNAVGKWSAGDVFSDAKRWTDPSLSLTIQFPDVDGDGRADVCTRTPTSILCQRALPKGGFDDAFELMEFGNDPSGQPPSRSAWATIRFPDIDGDGKADVCGRKPDGLWCALSTGASFFPVVLSSPEFSDASGFQDPLYAGSIQFADLDGDGADDVCGRSANGVTCAFADGNGKFVRPATLAAFTDAEGWNEPSRASTLTLLYLTRDRRRGCPPRLSTPFSRTAARLLR